MKVISEKIDIVVLRCPVVHSDQCVKPTCQCDDQLLHRCWSRDISVCLSTCI